jgi:chemotaxis protein methyltransferase CheR
MIAMTEEEFRLLRDFVRQRTGVRLADGKESLLQNRLRGQLRARGLARYADYYEVLKGGDPTALGELIDCVTTHTTGFFRFRAQLVLFARTVLPGVFERLRARPLETATLWSAGCSSGEEPYSLAVAVSEAAPRELLSRFRILATDISKASVEQASRGQYPAAKTRGLDAAQRATHFRELPDGDLEARPALKKLISFQVENLGRAASRAPESVDVIFCRNVLIYFDEDFRRQVVLDFARALKPGGHLLLGPAEMLLHTHLPLEPVSYSVYRKF